MIVGANRRLKTDTSGLVLSRVESVMRRKRGAWKGMGEKEGEAGGEETKDKKGRSKDNLERRK